MRRPSLINASLVIAASYVVSNLAGFFTRALIHAQFGQGLEQDAYRLAFNIPDLLFNLLAGGALASAFIPTYAGRLAQGQHAEAWRLAKRVALMVMLIVGAVAAIAVLAAPWLIQQVIAPEASVEAQTLTAELMRVLLISTVVFGLSGLLMGQLQSNGNFLAPALAPVLYNGGQIFGALALVPIFGVYGLAYGVVLGALLHLAVQAPFIRSPEFRVESPESGAASPESRVQSPVRPDSALSTHNSGLTARDSGLGTPDSRLSTDLAFILRAMPLRMLGSGAVYVNNIVRDRLASGAMLGAVSALNSAFAIMILPQAVIAQAISTALFPTISAHAARGERAEFARAMTQAINIIIALSMPAAAGLIVLGQPLIALLFQRGQFDAQDTRQAALALAMYGVGLLGHCVLEIVTRAFYALKDNRLPVLLAVGSVCVNIALSLTLLRTSWFPLGFMALALANSIATTLEAIMLYAFLMRRTPELALRSTVSEFVKSAVATAVMSAVAVTGLAAAGNSAIATLGTLLLSALVYFALATLLKSELVGFVRRIARR